MTEPTIDEMISYLEDFIELCSHEDLEDSEMATEHDVKMYRAIADRLRAMQRKERDVSEGLGHHDIDWTKAPPEGE